MKSVTKHRLRGMVLFIGLFIALALFGQQTSVDPSNSQSSEKALGMLVKARLEGLHIARKTIDDSLSQKAFKMLLERYDGGKQYFLKSDVEALKKYEFKLDDALRTGQFDVLNEMSKLYFSRVKQIQKMSQEILAQPFDLAVDESLETDPEKRDFPKDEKELKELWRKILKLSVVTRYMTFEEEQNPNKKVDEKEKKKTAKKKVETAPTKILTPKELEEKSRDGVKKSYEAIFVRMLQENRYDQVEKFVNAISMTFDPHTNYMPPEKKEDFDIDMSGKLEGIGALLGEDGPYIKVVKIIPGSASWKQKELQAEDVILKVGQAKDDPVEVVNMRVNDVVKLIRGEKGSEVRLTVKRPDGTIKVIPIVRDVVQVEESYAKGINVTIPGAVDYKVGYINLPKFYRDFEAMGSDKEVRNCTQDVRLELERLKKSGAKGFILDLRNNGGGALEDAHKMTGLFIKEGPVVQVKDHEGNINVLKDDDPAIVWDGPLVILTNKFSASASEILAAALQDYGRAVIVGTEYTHGKGTVQAVVGLDQGLSQYFNVNEDMGALKITIQKFYRINGSSTQYKGVTPDLILPDPYDYIESGEQFLDYSLPWSQVGPVAFRQWSGRNWDINGLKRLSKERISKDPNFVNISKRTEILKRRKQDTNQSLALAKFKAKQEQQIKEMEALEVKTLAKSMKFSDHKPTKQKLDDVMKEERKEFEETLGKDPMLEEAVFVISDLVSAPKVAAGTSK